MPDDLRLFIAADISDAQRRGAGDLIDRLKKGAQFTKAHPKWVRPDRMHLTLKFLGNVPETRVPDIVSTVQNVTGRYRPFDISIEGLGVFPNENRPKVVWIGVKQGRKALGLLAGDIDRNLSHIGFERERRDFHPHLTLARLAALRGSGALMDIVHSHKAYALGESTVDSVTLYRSELGPQGPTYTVLHRWPLGRET